MTPPCSPITSSRFCTTSAQFCRSLWLSCNRLELEMHALIAIVFATPAYASTGWNNAAGCGVPAPEIGSGVLGAILSVAALKLFRGLR